MKNERLKLGYAACIFAGLMLAGGCAQNNETPVTQTAGQTTPTTTDQDAATQGSQVYVYVVNAPGKDGLPQPGDFQSTTGLGAAILAEAGTQVSSDGAGNSTAGAKAGYVQSGLTINVTTGGTTPSLTGSTTGSATQTPTASPASSPTQHIDPRISASVPIAVAQPGGMIDQQATAATEGSTASPTKTSENELRWQRIEAAADQLEKIAPLLQKFFETQTPETQPVDAETGNGTGG